MQSRSSQPAPDAMIFTRIRTSLLARARQIRAKLRPISAKRAPSSLPPAKSVSLRSSLPRSARLRRKGLNVLILGGSNTAIRNGYAPTLLACLADQFGPLGTVKNIAIGGNSSVHGLMIAKALPNLAQYDLVLIEYGVNDVKLSGPSGFPLWCATVEGLVRYLLSNRPNRLVMHIQLARAEIKPRHHRTLRGIVRLTAHYAPSHPVRRSDVDHLLRRVLFPQPDGLRSLYVADQVHYARPMATALIATRVAADIGPELGPALALPRSATAAPLPEPLWSQSFAEAQVIDLAAPSPGLVAAAPPGPPVIRRFANSMIEISALRLAVGESLTLDLPGPLICLEFISTPQAASLRLIEDDRPPLAFHTRHIRAGEKNFPFLVRALPATWIDWQQPPAAVAQRVRLEATATPDPAELQSSSRMTATPADATEGIYLTRLLCLGAGQRGRPD